jgi:hypothetical protein
MENDKTYFLNKSWNTPMLVLDIVGFIFFTGLAVLTFIQDGQRLGIIDIGTTVFFALLGLELIDERLHSRIEISVTEIVYYQPRFSLACNWRDLVGFLNSGYGTALIFSDSEILSGGLILFGLRLMGPWHRMIPITPYLTRENRGQIYEIVSSHLGKLSDSNKAILKRRVGPQS